MNAAEDQDGAQRRVVLTVGIALGALVAIVLVALLAGGGGDEETDFAAGTVPPREVGDLNRAVELSGCSVEDHESEGRTGTGEDVDYEADPPHSGDHAPEPAVDDAYRSDPPPEENVVHTLFHGRIVIWFRDDVAEDDLGDLKALYDEDSAHMLMVPRDSMDVPVAATAWRHSLLCPEMNDGVFDAVRAFRDTWRDTAPEFVP